VAGRRIWKTLKRKTAIFKITEKKIVSETERKLVVRIPRVVGFRPIVVQPQTVVIAFEVEDVRVSIGVRIA
jgi:hypothetical protein